jgi:DNA (cytosine-5)-methyltransferase 1
VNELALFAGGGGGILGGKLLGWRTVCAVEIHDYNQAVLAARQADGCLAPFPVWNDVRSFTKRNGQTRPAIRALRRIRHSLIITGGFPCQDISSAGEGAGIDGARSGLWREFARIIREVGPYNVLVENSAMLTSRGLGRVLGDLAAMGYDAVWGVLSAADAIWYLGDPCLDHERKRIWIFATLSDSSRQRRGETRQLRYSQPQEWAAGRNQAGAHSMRDGWVKGWAERGPVCGFSEPAGVRGQVSHAVCDGRLEMVEAHGGGAEGERIIGPFASRAGSWWSAEPDVDRVAHGVADRVDRLYSIGNGQVPAVVALAYRTLSAI